MKKLALFLLMTGTVLAGCQKLELNAPGNLVPLTVTEDPALPSISVNNTRLHAETFGKATDPMLVILHGGPGGDYRSMLNCKLLADEGYYVIFYDQRGSGLSQRHAMDAYTMHTMYDDLDAVIRHYRKSPDQKLFLLGMSWGAMLATEYINANPQAVDGVILAEPGGLNFTDMKNYLSRSREVKFFDESMNDVLYADQMMTGNADQQNTLDYRFELMTAEDFAKGSTMGEDKPVPFWRWGAVVNGSLMKVASKQGFDWTGNLQQYHTKILFLYSELNKAYGKAYAEKISSAYPSVDLEEIKGSGHDVFTFGWDNTYPLVKKYLNSFK